MTGLATRLGLSVAQAAWGIYDLVIAGTCDMAPPPEVEIGPGHRAACHLYADHRAHGPERPDTLRHG